LHALIKILDAQVRPNLRRNEQLLREWEVAKRVQHGRTSSGEPSTLEASIPAVPTATPSPALKLTA
jgi:hypothetical protein